MNLLQGDTTLICMEKTQILFWRNCPKPNTNSAGFWSSQPFRLLFGLFECRSRIRVWGQLFNWETTKTTRSIEGIVWNFKCTENCSSPLLDSAHRIWTCGMYLSLWWHKFVFSFSPLLCCFQHVLVPILASCTKKDIYLWKNSYQRDTNIWTTCFPSVEQTRVTKILRAASSVNTFLVASLNPRSPWQDFQHTILHTHEQRVRLWFIWEINLSEVSSYKNENICFDDVVCGCSSQGHCFWISPPMLAILDCVANFAEVDCCVWSKVNLVFFVSSQQTPCSVLCRMKSDDTSQNNCLTLSHNTEHQMQNQYQSSMK